MSGVMGTWAAEGALAALGAWKADARDDWRDAEPGKLPHELRRGELAHLVLIPHTPYYGTHDAQPLYCLALWNAWRWSGEARLLDAHLGTALAALRWCDDFGDRDGDGLQEYVTRSRQGYYNQGWKDAGDALVHEDGAIAELPLAPVELQGYLYTARLAMAELMEASGEPGEARRLRGAAAELRAAVEDRYWLGDAGCYAMALDGHKQPVRSVGSNPGQLLWTGLPEERRARAVARRLLGPDLSSGWGLRTLSSQHVAYNPLSYQRGSVWPHDTALAAAGMWRYGLREEAAQLLQALLEAAGAFEDEGCLSCSAASTAPWVGRSPTSRPTSPRPGGRQLPCSSCKSCSAWFPMPPGDAATRSPGCRRGCPRLEVRGLVVGRGSVDVAAVRAGSETVVDALGSSDVEVVLGEMESPLWGRPPPATRSPTSGQ